MFIKRHFIFIIVLVLGLISLFLFKKENNSFKVVFETCSKQETSRLRMECFSKGFESDFEKRGTKALLSDLEKIITENDNSENGGITKCHDAAHSIGMIAGMYGRNVEESFSSCTNLCGFGCHMGVIEGYFHMNGKELDNFPEICRNSSHPYSCVHSVGHYVAHTTHDIHKSLLYCNKIPEIEYRGHCTSGVFMEAFEQPIHADYSFPIPSDLTVFCNSLNGVHKSFCFTMSGFYEYLRTNSFEEGIKMCQKAPEKELCFNNYSKALYYRQNGSASKMHDFCSKVPKEFLGSCQDGILNASGLSDPILRHGFEFCSLYEGDDRISCFEKLGSYIEGESGDNKKRTSLCEKLNNEDKDSCLTSN